MKILVVQDSDWLKRNNHQQHHLMDRLSLRGHEIRVIDFPILWREENHGLISKRQVFTDVHKVDDRAKVTVIRPGLIKVTLLDYASMLFTYYRDIEEQIKYFKPDVVIGFGIITSKLALESCHRHNIPFVHYWLDTLDQLIPIKPLRPLGRSILKKTVLMADKVITINQSLNSWVSYLGAKNPIIIGAGVDKTLYNDKVDGTKMREKYGFTPDDTVLFYMGWLYKFSGVMEVICELIMKDKPNLKFLVVGDGDDFNNIQSAVREFELTKSVILTGRRPYTEIPELIASADVCLLPAYCNEPTMQNIVPIKMYEYLAMGKPVISTKLPGIMKEFWVNNGVSYINTISELVPMVQSAVLDGKLKEEGKLARQFMYGRDWDTIVANFEIELRRLIK